MRVPGSAGWGARTHACAGQCGVGGRAHTCAWAFGAGTRVLHRSFGPMRGRAHTEPLCQCTRAQTCWGGRACERAHPRPACRGTCPHMCPAALEFARKRVQSRVGVHALMRAHVCPDMSGYTHTHEQPCWLTCARACPGESLYRCVVLHACPAVSGHACTHMPSRVAAHTCPVALGYGALLVYTCAQLCQVTHMCAQLCCVTHMCPTMSSYTHMYPAMLDYTHACPAVSSYTHMYPAM